MLEQPFCDAHIHVGQFYDQYTQPTELKRFLDSVGIEFCIVSSTTVCEKRYENVIEEIRDLQILYVYRLLPVLWIVPQMFNDGGLELFIDSGIQWRCLKIHPQLHPEAWLPEKEELGKVLSLANALEVPLLIHTGEKEGCYPSLYEKAFSEHPNVIFILAHGRPISETIQLMKKCSNVWADTAFMPTEHICRLCEEDLSDRVLWGTDYPIPKFYYPNENMVEYYAKLLDNLKKNVSQEDYKKITYINAFKLFKINK